MRELKPDVLLTPKVVWLIRIGSETQDFCCPILTRVISHHSSKWGMYKGQSFEDLCGLPLKGKRHPLSWKWTSRGSKPQSFELTPPFLRLGLERRMELVSKHSWLCHVLSFNGGQESTDRLPLWEALVCLEGSFPFELLWGFHMSERTDQNSKRGPRQGFPKLHTDVSVLENWKHTSFLDCYSNRGQTKQCFAGSHPVGTDNNLRERSWGLESLGQHVQRLGIPSPWNVELMF